MKSFSGNIALVAFSLVQARVMMSFYQGLLLSSIIRPPNTDPFKNADDVIKLVASGEYKLITNYIGNWYFESVSYVILGDKYWVPPTFWISEISDCWTSEKDN